MIDFHCHVDLYSNPSMVIRAAEEGSIGVLSVTNTPSAWRGTSQLAIGRSVVRTALGLHPQLARERKFELKLFDELLPGAQFVGEIGLDGSPAFRPIWEDQQDVFTHIVARCESSGGRIMSIHSRKAVPEVLKVLNTFPRAGVPILHWFSGSLKQLAASVDSGCWFSVGPSMLASANGRALAREMPRERVLLETDGPFTQSRGRPLIPRNIDRAVPLLAEIWGLSGHEVQDQIEVNETSIQRWRSEKVYAATPV